MATAQVAGSFAHVKSERPLQAPARQLYRLSVTTKTHYSTLRSNFTLNFTISCVPYWAPQWFSLLNSSRVVIAQFLDQDYLHASGAAGRLLQGHLGRALLTSGVVQ